ncbi:hypothetical protein [Burkholderia ambifaria]|uniref:hypothetical protein n=1 Tax=Burkholderia ambifaria TaxID=152480 RepID=UPI0018E06752|nr:hypothetical protein [Burkholderia ambifaria]
MTARRRMVDWRGTRKRHTGDDEFEYYGRASAAYTGCRRHINFHEINRRPIIC